MHFVHCASQIMFLLRRRMQCKFETPARPILFPFTISVSTVLPAVFLFFSTKQNSGIGKGGGNDREPEAGSLGLGVLYSQFFSQAQPSGSHGVKKECTEYKKKQLGSNKGKMRPLPVRL